VICVAPQVSSHFSLIVRPPEILSSKSFTSLDTDVLHLRVVMVFGNDINRILNQVAVVTNSACDFLSVYLEPHVLCVSSCCFAITENWECHTCPGTHGHAVSSYSPQLKCQLHIQQSQAQFVWLLWERVKDVES
jgi:hypothetical protein